MGEGGAANLGLKQGGGGEIWKVMTLSAQKILKFGRYKRS